MASKVELEFKKRGIDVRLGRRVEIDPRNADYPMRSMLPLAAYQKPRTKIWDAPIVLDQGATSACVGFSFAAELLAKPYQIKGITGNDGQAIYQQAQKLDQWPGEQYYGTSVLAGAKATMKLYEKTFESYRWCNNLQDSVAAVGWHGPLVIGVEFYSSMYTVDADGFFRVSGEVVGGHAMLIRGVLPDKYCFVVRNSWGAEWGRNGDAFLSFYDFSRLLERNGEALCPVHRGWWKKPA